MNEIQQQLEDLKKRVADLEAAEIRLRVQSIGPRGPIGPPGFIGQQGPAGPEGAAGRDGKNGVDGRDGATPGKDEFESILVTLLQEYKLLDENSLPYTNNNPYAKK
jgi:hypothetical protein